MRKPACIVGVFSRDPPHHAVGVAGLALLEQQLRLSEPIPWIPEFSV